jgi:hypothetical protein
VDSHQFASRVSLLSRFSTRIPSRNSQHTGDPFCTYVIKHIFHVLHSLLRDTDLNITILCHCNNKGTWLSLHMEFSRTVLYSTASILFHAFFFVRDYISTNFHIFLKTCTPPSITAERLGLIICIPKVLCTDLGQQTVCLPCQRLVVVLRPTFSKTLSLD